MRVVGDVWDETHEAALRYSETMEALYISPFDDPVIWQGHSTIIDEIVEEMEPPPDAVVVSVGGGGLLCGVIAGLQRHGLKDLPVIAVETEGTASLAASLKEGKLVTLERISGIAKSLGAKTVARQAFQWSTDHPVHSVVVTDTDAVRACIKFADDHRHLVEPACGASLSVAYRQHRILENADRLVVVVCGGIGINLNLLQSWQAGLKALEPTFNFEKASC